MTRIVEHRSALPFGTVVEVHVHRGPVADAPMLATVTVTKFSSRPDPNSFVDPLTVANAFCRHSPMPSGPGSPAYGSMIQTVISRRRNGGCTTRFHYDIARCRASRHIRAFAVA